MAPPLGSDMTYSTPDFSILISIAGRHGILGPWYWTADLVGDDHGYVELVCNLQGITER